MQYIWCLNSKKEKSNKLKLGGAFSFYIFFNNIPYYVDENCKLQTYIPSFLNEYFMLLCK